MGLRHEAALAATLAALASVPALANADPTVMAPAPDPALVDFCVNEAIGVENDAQRATFDPTSSVASGYVGKSVTKFFFENNTTAVSDDCKDIITSRETTASQTYRGKVNSAAVVYSGLGATVNDRKVVRLRAPFTPIKGRGVRGYTEKVTTTVKYEGGVYTKHGSVVVRGKTDGA